jgi:hypothetical protein
VNDDVPITYFFDPLIFVFSLQICTKIGSTQSAHLRERKELSAIVASVEAEERERDSEVWLSSDFGVIFLLYSLFDQLSLGCFHALSQFN